MGPLRPPRPLPCCRPTVAVSVNSCADSYYRLPGSQVHWTQPASHHHPPLPLPPTHPPTHPLIHDTHDIRETFQKTLQNQ